LATQFHVFDARTQHVKKGFTSLTERVANSSTVWGLKHLPQNRDVMMVQVNHCRTRLGCQEKPVVFNAQNCHGNHKARPEQ
jgi:hypothetical protein